MKNQTSGWTKEIKKQGQEMHENLIKQEINNIKVWEQLFTNFEWPLIISDSVYLEKEDKSFYSNSIEAVTGEAEKRLGYKIYPKEWKPLNNQLCLCILSSEFPEEKYESLADNGDIQIWFIVCKLIFELYKAKGIV